MVNEEVDEWVTPEEVAEVMLALIQQDEVGEIIGDKNTEGKMFSVKGGTILEVSKTVRPVSAWNDPGPTGRVGNTTGNMKLAEEEVFELLSQEGWGQLTGLGEEGLIKSYRKETEAFDIQLCDLVA
jgi:3-hydroxybutyrate dehydrogenase